MRGSDTLLLLDRPPSGETGSPSLTVGAERGEEAPRLSITFEPEAGQAVVRGVYWRSGQFDPGRRERHGLLFSPLAFRLDADGWRLGDPRREAPEGEEEAALLHGSAAEAAAHLLELLEHFHRAVRERSD